VHPAYVTYCVPVSAQDEVETENTVPTIVRSSVPVEDAFDAMSVTSKTSGVAGTAPVGVPEISPSEPRLNPAGRVPEISLQIVGDTPPVEVS
jgi:hypothetical protein